MIAGEPRSNVTAATIFAASRRPAMQREARRTPTRTSVKWSSAARDTNETMLCDVAGLSGSLGRLSVTRASVSVSLEDGAGMLLTCSGGTHHRLRPLGEGTLSCRLCKVSAQWFGSTMTGTQSVSAACCCSLHAECRWGKDNTTLQQFAF